MLADPIAFIARARTLSRVIIIIKNQGSHITPLYIAAIRDAARKYHHHDFSEIPLFSAISPATFPVADAIKLQTPFIRPMTSFTMRSFGIHGLHFRSNSFIAKLTKEFGKYLQGAIRGFHNELAREIFDKLRDYWKDIEAPLIIAACAAFCETAGRWTNREIFEYIQSAMLGPSRQDIRLDRRHLSIYYANGLITGQHADEFNSFYTSQLAGCTSKDDVNFCIKALAFGIEHASTIRAYDAQIVDAARAEMRREIKQLDMWFLLSHWPKNWHKIYLGPISAEMWSMIIFYARDDVFAESVDRDGACRLAARMSANERRTIERDVDAGCSIILNPRITARAKKRAIMLYSKCDIMPDMRVGCYNGLSCTPACHIM